VTSLPKVLESQFKKEVRDIPGQTNVPIAAAVTAYSRMIINQFKLDAINAGLNIYYSDTDSLVVDGPLPEVLCDPAKLGKLKLEYSVKEGIFVAPKISYLESDKGEVFKCKGYSGKLNKDQYLSLLKGQRLDLTVTRWSRDLKEVPSLLVFLLKCVFISSTVWFDNI
jgi:hypothetical protein